MMIMTMTTMTAVMVKENDGDDAHDDDIDDHAADEDK